MENVVPNQHTMHVFKICRNMENLGLDLYLLQQKIFCNRFGSLEILSQGYRPLLGDFFERLFQPEQEQGNIQSTLVSFAAGVALKKMIFTFFSPVTLLNLLGLALPGISELNS
jgi:hypothetical protein